MMTAAPSGLSPAGQAAVALLRSYVDASGGRAQHRPQQEGMTAAVADAIATETPLIVQAGTGTGKSIGYLTAIASTRQHAVISTATKALSEQLIDSDIPALNAHLVNMNESPVRAALLKGRSNYVCKVRLDEINTLSEADINAPALLPADTLTADADASDEAQSVAKPSKKKGRRKKTDGFDTEAYVELLQWANTTTTGDRSHAPACDDSTWEQVSMSAQACPGRTQCPFGDVCFTEIARLDARTADLVVTNHALLALDLMIGSPMFGEFPVVIADEVHELEKVLSNSWGSDFNTVGAVKMIKQATKVAANDDAIQQYAKDALTSIDHIDATLTTLTPGLLPDIPAPLKVHMDGLKAHIAGIASKLGRIADVEQSSARGMQARTGTNLMQSLRDTITDTLREPGQTVRWVEARERTNTVIIKTAPLEVGGLLRSRLGDRTLIATSATCTVGGAFTPMSRALGLALPDDERDPGDTRDYTSLDVGSPFDWRTAAMLYIPDDPFPEPVGKDRIDHTNAVLDTLLTLTAAAGGRTLFLSTTTAGAKRAADHLRANLPPTVTVYAHGDGTAGQLAEWFADDETSVLCATMGMWAGINIVGNSCILVVVDKIPFPPMDDPLSSARAAAIDARGGSGFMEISVAHAGLMLAQGAGRLIRSATDKGVIAILDRRLHTKRYGKQLIRSLPPVGVFREEPMVAGALTRLASAASATADSAVAAPDRADGAERTRETPLNTPETSPLPATRAPAPTVVSRQRRNKPRNWSRTAGTPITATARGRASTDRSGPDPQPPSPAGAHADDSTPAVIASFDPDDERIEPAFELFLTDEPAA